MTAAAAGFLSASASPTRASVTMPPRNERWRWFEITTHVVLPDARGAAALWLPLAQTAEGYQTGVDIRWQGNGAHGVARDATYGAAVLRSTWPDGASARQVTVVQTVMTRDRGSLPTVPLSTVERRFWTQGTADIPTDGIVRDTAQRIVGSLTDPRQRLRALYDWVVDTTWRDANTAGCGLGDIRSMLESGRFGGKCADINGLMTGLARAAGFPARDVYGIRVADSALFPALGRGGDITRAQHCRTDVFLDDAGWFPLDPADVRKVVLEQKLPIDSPEVRALRNRLFGQWEMNWIGYNSATGIALPGAEGWQRPNFAFLMYPCGFVGSLQLDTLDPGTFRYSITSRELPG